MKYVALLRGINVGGNRLIKMSALKQCFEHAGFDNVSTFIASGNVIFESKETSAPAMVGRIEEALSRTFGFDCRIVLVSRASLKAIVDNVPADWPSGSDLRRYVAFLRPAVTPAQAAKHVATAPGIDRVDRGKGVLYLTTKLSDLARSRLSKVVSTPIYREMTIRGYSTCERLLTLLDREEVQPAPRRMRRSAARSTSGRKPASRA